MCLLSETNLTLLVGYVTKVWAMKNIPSRAVRQFPDMFPGATGANQKTDRYFKDIETIVTPKNTNRLLNKDISFSKVTSNGVCVSLAKEEKGNGRKRQVWLKYLNTHLMKGFDCYRKTGLNGIPLCHDKWLWILCRARPLSIEVIQLR